MKRFLVMIFLLCGIGQALAVQPDEMLKDPAQEARARAISSQLRCLVCQNQSIDDSDAPLARDLRLLLREHIAKGESDGQVMDYIVARYGDYVLLKPPFALRTLILWAFPFVVLLIAGVALFRRRASGPADAEKPLTPEERAALDKLGS